VDDPISRTVKTYQQSFEKYLQRTPRRVGGEFKAWIDSFLSRIPRSGTILEIGSASGRDARYFLEKGYRVVCTDVVPQALQELVTQGFETAEFDFRDTPRPEWTNRFEGFFANGVLLHAPPSVFRKVMQNITTVLKENGVAAFSLKAGEGEEISTEKMASPRYFRYYTEQEIRQILENLPFEIMNVSYADSGKWLHFIIQVNK
jgi:SAM-dependent methyltransferase